MKKLMVLAMVIGLLGCGCKVTQCNWTKSDMSQWNNDVTQCNYATNIYCQTYGSVVTPGRVEGGGVGVGGIYSGTYTVIPPKRECSSGEADKVKGDCLRMKGYEVQCEEVETSQAKKQEDIPDWLKARRDKNWKEGK